jgi:hypothetical protein
MPRRKKKVNNTPIKVGDYVKIGLSGMGSEAYVVEEIHYKENKDGIVLDAEEKPVVANYTVVLTETSTNGTYTHRVGENGTMFVTGKPGYKKTNLRSRLTKV